MLRHQQRGPGRPPRLRTWDYSNPAAYFVTFCVDRRRRCLGAVVPEGVALSAAGQIVWQVWLSLPSHFPWVELDRMVVMPDHVHGIVRINRSPAACGPGLAVAAGRWYPLMQDSRPLLGKVVRCWKAGSTRRIRTGACPGFRWQSSYYDRVIRDETALNRTRRYVDLNPRRAWLVG